MTNEIELGTTALTDLPERSLVYNDAGRLFELYIDGTLTAQYLYNDEGQRTRKTVHLPGGATETTVYHYDPMGYLITETDHTGALIRDYIWTENMHPVAQIDSDGVVEDVVYLYTDHLMTSRVATDSTQTVVWRWQGEAFGETSPDQNPDGDAIDTVVDLRFPGQYFDSESELYYNHFRYYDPRLARFITSDREGLDGGINSYGYGFANPVTAVDPLGLAVYRYGNEYRQTRSPGAGDCMKPVYAGEFVIRWIPCDQPDVTNPNDPITQAAVAKAVSMDSNRSRTRGLSPTSRVGRPLGRISRPARLRKR